MNVKTLSDIRMMEKACSLAAEALQYTGKFVKAGVTTEELDQIANDFIRSRDAVSACVGYYGYPKAICTSVNDVICHGVPDGTKLKDGDIINIDITVLKNGFHGDTSSMFFVGPVSEQAKRLSICARLAMEAGIAEVRTGNTTGDIGYATESLVKKHGFHVVREIGGHGIGKKFHEDPYVPSFGRKGRGARLLKWGTITVEPMVNETAAPIEEFEIEGSDITVFTTSDGRLSAQYEHTVLITDEGPRILTLV